MMHRFNEWFANKPVWPVYKGVLFMKNKRLLTILSLAALVFCLVGAATAGAAQRVLVLPFNMKTPQDLNYLQQGIMDMLTSRLDWPGQVEVIPKAEAMSLFRKAAGGVDEATARRFAQSLGVDYVVFGSVTSAESGINLDASMISLKSGPAPVNLISQAPSLDSVIPKVTEFAQNINTTVFKRSATASAPTAQPQAKGQPSPGASKQPVAAQRRHPDYVLTGEEGDRLSAVNPNFIAAIGGEEKEGAVWRSPSLPVFITGLDVADLDGDGKNETVYTSRSSVYVARMENGVLRRLTMFEGPAGDNILSVDVADINGNGRPEIFVSNQRDTAAKSYVFEFANNRLTPILKDVPYYFRVMKLQNGPTLLGQRGADDNYFQGDVQTMTYSGGQYKPGGSAGIPKTINVFQFTLANLTGTGKEFLVSVKSKDNVLKVQTRNGNDLWSSEASYAGTGIYMRAGLSITDGNTTFYETTDDKRLYIPSRLLTADLNGDGIDEIIVAKNDRPGVSDMFDRWRTYSHGEVDSLSYTQMGMKENWRSRRLPGPIIDYQIKDFNNDGRPDLVVAVVLEVGRGMVDSRSVIVSYELASPEEIKAAEKKRDKQ